MTAKLELNIRTLLVQCEELVKEEDQRWRLPRYIKSIDSMIQELKDWWVDNKFESILICNANFSPNWISTCIFSETADKNNIANYTERTLEIKTAINYIEPPEVTRKLKNRNTDVDDGILKEIKQLNSAKMNEAVRRDLFDGEEAIGLRKRGAQDSSENMEKYYANIQEKLGEEMLSLTRNLKEQTLTASKIIKKDTDTVLKSTKMAHNNQGSLEKESKKLDEHNRRGEISSVKKCLKVDRV